MKKTTLIASKGKCILLLLQALAFCFGALSVTAAGSEELAEILSAQSECFDGGDGTEDSPYQIATAEQLRTMAELVNAHSTKQDSPYVSAYYILTDDIDLGEDGASWTPIGDGYLDGVSSFSGSFDGDGHVISGLTIEAGAEADLRYYGLFGAVEGSVSNVILEASAICVSAETGYYAGGIAGCLSGGTITDCVTRSDVSVSAYYNAGGIVGLESLSTSLVTGCESAAKVSTMAESAGNAGGIAASASGTLEGCVNTGTIAGGYTAGGIAGTMMGEEMSGCENQGTVTGVIAGGICGTLNLQQTDGTQISAAIAECVNGGSVTAASAAGGVIASLTASTADVLVKDCENSADVSGTEQAAGIIGTFSGSTASCSLAVENSSNSGDIAVAEEKEDGGAGTGEAAGILAASALRRGGSIGLVSCSNSGAVAGGSLYAGGILGVYLSTAVDDEEAETVLTLTACINEAAVTGGGAYGIGGIAGFIDSENMAVALTITGCSNAGTLYADAAAPLLGGILGYLAPHQCNAEISGCSNTGDLTMAEMEIAEEEGWFDFTVAAGGVVGYIGAKGAVIDLSDDCGISGTDPAVIFEDCENAGEIAVCADGREFLTGDLYGAASVAVQE